MDSPCHQQLRSDDAPPSPEELRSMIEEKASELFAVCDLEEKGFVNKLDMRRLVGELPGLDELQLEYVFDSLDEDGNGFLTLEEFTQGFGGFLGINSATEEPPPSPGLYEVQKRDEVTDTLEQDFHQAMESLGANEVFTEEGVLRAASAVTPSTSHDDVSIERKEQIQALWTKLREENPDLLGNFEEVLRKVSNDVKSATNTQGELEQVLKSRSNIHEEQVSKLYQEMEQQIQGEKDKLIAQEKEREKRDREEMDLEMRRKEELLHELLKKQTELEGKLTQLSSTEKQTKEEKERLEEDNNKLYGQLDYTEKDLEQTRSYLSKLQERIKEEKRARADASLSVTRGIAEERASLCTQLSLLRDMNKKLVDERDAIKLEKEVTEKLSDRNPMVKQGSVMSDYFDPSEEQDQGSDINDNSRVIDEEDVEYDFAYEHTTGSLPTQNSKRTPTGYVTDEHRASSTHNGYLNGHTNGHQNGDTNRHTNGHTNGHLYDEGDFSDETDSDLRALRGNDHRYDSPPLSEELAHSLHQELQATQESALYSTPESGGLHQWSTSGPLLHAADGLDSDIGMDTVIVGEVLRGPGEGEESPLEGDGTGSKLRTQTSESGTETTNEDHPHLRDPQRLYKVVFVGDSYVGKTSLLHRICNGTFLESFNATIGVDFQVKTMSVNGHSVAIQLWDTAGQERYRSIARHYFRKSDAVVVVYDITSEKSFLSVRNWMSNIEEVTDEHVVKVIVGNKLDAADSRQVEADAGKSFAEAYQCLFYEASALDGTNVAECLEDMAQRLLEKEDREMEEALKLINEVVAKKKCCKS